MRFLTEHTTGIPETMVRGHTGMLAGTLARMREAARDMAYHSPESALAAPFDTAACDAVCSIAERLRPSLRTVLLVGIGGSDLGTRAVYDALAGYAERYRGTRTPTLVQFATIEPSILPTVREIINKHERPEELALIVISKSGTTTETAVNAAVLHNALTERFPGAQGREHVIVVSDADSPLARTAREQSFTAVAMPKSVGGRYSVFTPVGLLPLALLGFNARSFLEGAAKGVAASVPEQGMSVAAIRAAHLFESYLKGHAIHELFLFNPELETLGKWYRQLLAESIGKERHDGTRIGLMPTVAIGSNDLHSLGQLVFGGPVNRFTTFVAAPSAWEGGEPCGPGPFTLPMTEGKTPGTVMRAIYDSVRTTYATHGLPHVSIELDGINERELGAYMALEMASVMCLASLFDVNAFDQPNVEAYKKEVRRILTSQ